MFVSRDLVAVATGVQCTELRRPEIRISGCTRKSH